MEISHDKLKKELSEYYKLGWNTNKMDTLVFLSKKIQEVEEGHEYIDQKINEIIAIKLNEISEELLDYYNSYPLCDKITDEQVKQIMEDK